MEQLTFRLPVYSGPLDLLLQLIAAHKMDIYDIPIAEILDQYLEQIERMRRRDLTLAAEFLEMAARLIYIKTAQLLPQSETAAELKRQITEELLEYRAVQLAAGQLRLRGNGRAAYVREPTPLPNAPYERQYPVSELTNAYRTVAGRLARKAAGAETMAQFEEQLAQKPVSVASKIVYLIRRLIRCGETAYPDLFDPRDGGSARVATFLALLELLKARRLLLREADGIQYIRLRAPGDEPEPMLTDEAASSPVEAAPAREELTGGGDL